MVIGTAGFSWSGSSAVSDFLKEFNENQVYSDIEFVLAYTPDGLEDLDYHLNKSCSKFLSSTVAIPRFRKTANFILGVVTKGKIKKLTEKYIDSITQVTWIGNGQGQDALHNSWIYKNLGIRVNGRLQAHLPVKLCKMLRLYPMTKMEFSIMPDEFYKKTIDYTNGIFELLGLDINRNIVLDQAFAGTDPAKSLPYFQDAKAVLVDRDPRDLYVLAKKYFSKLSYPIPYEKVEDFVCYYKNMHKSLKKNCINPDVLYIRFEDFVYQYEETAKKIKIFLNLQKHDNPRKYFIPEMSMVNTQLYKKFPELQEDIEYIQNELVEYLFNFDNYEYRPIQQEVFDKNPNIL